MALNPNHGFEDLGENKCAIVEKNCSQARVEFLKKILEFNQYKVIVVASPPPKAAAKPVAVPAGENPEATVTAPAETPKAPETFTVGVTDITFNPINAIFNRELKTPDGHIVTPKYWKQEDNVAHDEKWYWMK